MKKLTLLIALLFSLSSVPVYAATPVQLPAKSGMAIEVRTGKILFEKKADEVVPVGNLSRVLTLYLTYQAVKDGKLSWDQVVTVSDQAYNLSYNSEVSYLSFTKDRYTIKDLVKASLISASSAATLALAEEVAGSEEKAVVKMADLLKKWDIDGGILVNSTGVNPLYLTTQSEKGDTQTTQENSLTARQLATVSYHLVSDFPEILDLAKATKANFGGDPIYTFNYLLENMPYARPNAYGLLTGSSDHGSSLIAMSYENQMQVLVVMIDVDGGQEDSEKRFMVANSFFDQIGNHFHLQKVIAASSNLKDTVAPVLDGVAQTVPAVTQDDFFVVTTPETIDTFKLKAVFPEKTNYAPIKEGQEVGKVVFEDRVLVGKGYLGDLPSMPLIAEESVKRTHLFQIIWNHFVSYIIENL